MACCPDGSSHQKMSIVQPMVSNNTRADRGNDGMNANQDLTDHTKSLNLLLSSFGFSVFSWQDQHLML